MPDVRLRGMQPAASTFYAKHGRLMNRQSIFNRIWYGRGKVQVATMPEPATFDGAEGLLRLLLEAGSLTPIDIRSIRFLLELADSHGEARNSLIILLGLLHMRIRQGNVLLELKDTSARIELTDSLENAIDILNQQQAEHAGNSARQHSPSVSSAWANPCEMNQHIDGLAGLLNKGEYRTICGRPGGAQPLIYDNEAAAVYFQKYYDSRERIITHLNRRLSNDATDFAVADVRSELHALLAERAAYPGKQHFELNREQQLALVLSTFTRTLIVTGGPGTGKTAIAVYILRLLAHCMHVDSTDILLCAPTGRAAARLQESMHAAALSSAARRPIDLTDITSGTIHRILGYRPEHNGYVYNAHNKLPVRVVIVDEASMLDICLFAGLLDALDDRTHLVLIGDRFQLPSVDAGAVLGDLSSAPGTTAEQINRYSDAARKFIQAVLPSVDRESIRTRSVSPLADHVICLQQSHRSAQDIQILAQHINAGDARAALELLQAHPLDHNGGSAAWPVPVRMPDGAILCRPSSIRYIDTSNSGGDIQLCHLLESWTRFHFLSDRFCPQAPNAEPNAQRRAHAYREVLASLKAFGPFAGGRRELCERCGDSGDPVFALLDEACEYTLQTRILTYLRNGRYGAEGVNKAVAGFLQPRMDPAGTPELFSGMPIMITRNSPDAHLYNGDIGVILQIGAERFACFKRGNAFALFGPQSLPHFTCSFASTVHKSQGSEYAYVLLILPRFDTQLNSREIMYTAITRAKYLAVVAGNAKIIKRGTERSVSRQSALATGLQRP
ncbi:MAG: exodeoxyribonuclease V subunit alpha [Chitinivibrionales bacterium]|nr:exodeoxyribonuclease V subunit alpha [Chitinivibrionales bacterium]